MSRLNIDSELLKNLVTGPPSSPALGREQAMILNPVVRETFQSSAWIQQFSHAERIKRLPFGLLSSEKQIPDLLETLVVRSD